MKRVVLSVVMILALATLAACGAAATGTTPGVATSTGSVLSTSTGFGTAIATAGVLGTSTAAVSGATVVTTETGVVTETAMITPTTLTTGTAEPTGTAVATSTVSAAGVGTGTATTMATAVGTATTATPAAAGTSGVMPSITIMDQPIASGSVMALSVVSNGPGWLDIHADANGSPGAVIGHTAVVDGTNSNVVVTLNMTQATPLLWAMLHADAGTVGTYEFPGADQPVVVNGKVIQQSFNVTGGLSGTPAASGTASTLGVIGTATSY
jgi:hypothetical protein